MTTAERDLVDLLAPRLAPWAPGPESGEAAADVLHELRSVKAREVLVRWLGDTIGLDPLITALLDAYGPDSIMRSLVDTGTLVAVPSQDAVYRWAREGEHG